MKSDNNYVANLDLLETAYICEHATMKRFEERGVRINPFLLDYIVDENLNLFTQGNEKIINARAIMNNIDINELKKELYKLLIAYKEIMPNPIEFIGNDHFMLHRVRNNLSKVNSQRDIEKYVKRLFVDKSYYKLVIDSFNKHIDEALKQMINSKIYNDNWLLKPELSVRFKRLIKKN